MQESEKWKWSHSVVSHSERPHGLQPTRLLHPWDFPGKSTGVGCHCLLLATFPTAAQISPAPSLLYYASAALTSAFLKLVQQPLDSEPLHLLFHLPGTISPNIHMNFCFISFHYSNITAVSFLFFSFWVVGTEWMLCVNLELFSRFWKYKVFTLLGNNWLFFIAKDDNQN